MTFANSTLDEKASPDKQPPMKTRNGQAQKQVKKSGTQQKCVENGGGDDDSEASVDSEDDIPPVHSRSNRASTPQQSSL